MGYTHGKKWNDKLITEAVFEVVKVLGIDYFPTSSEMDEAYGSRGLSSAIRKRGGVRRWAIKTGLPIKKSCTTLGNRFENYAIREIEENTKLIAEYTTARYPYDILVDRSVKIDVKVSKLYHNTEHGYFCTFNLEKKKQTCDLYIFYCLTKEGKIYKRLIIPSVVLSGNSQIGIGQQSKWDVFLDRWNIISEYANFFSKYKKRPQPLKKRSMDLDEPIEDGTTDALRQTELFIYVP